LVHGTLGDVLKSNGAVFLTIGVAMGAIGIALCGVAGRNKEKDIAADVNNKTEFSLAKRITTLFFGWYLIGIIWVLVGSRSADR
jgi:hypothetical protein